MNGNSEIGKFENIIGRFIRLIMILVCGYLTVTSMYATIRITDTEHLYFAKDNPLVHIAVILVVIAVVAVCKKRGMLKVSKTDDVTSSENGKWGKTETLFYVVLLLYFILLCYLAISANLIPRFDPHRVSRVAVQVINGDYSAFMKGGYARLWDNQSGFILFLVGVYKLFGCNNYIAVQIINAISYTLMILFIRMLALRLVPEKRYLADITGILLCLFTPVYGYVTFIYGTAPALALSLGAMVLEYDYFNKEKQNILRILLAGILISLATVLKTNALIYLLTMLGYAFVKSLGLFRKGVKFVNSDRNVRLEEDDLPLLTRQGIRFIAFIFAIIWLALAYIIASKAISATMKNLTGMDDLSGTPRTAHIAMGLQESSNRSSGWYNGYNSEVFENNGYDHDAANAAAIVNIKMSLGKFKSQPSYAVGFFLKKIVSQWCEPTYDSLSVMMGRATDNEKVPGWLLLATEDGFGNKALTQYMNLFQTLIYFGCFAYFVMNFKRKDVHTFDVTFPAIAVIGGFLFHIMWEANSQYILVYVVLMIGYAVRGYDMAGERALSILAKKNGLHPSIAFLILALAIIITGIIPADTTLGRAVKMTWGDAEYREARAYAETGEADRSWAITKAEPSANYVEQRHSEFLGGVLDKGDIPNGRYILRPACDPDLTLMVEDASLNSGESVVLGSDGENRVILWYEDGGYSIRFQNSQLVADVEGAYDEPGTRVQQWEFNGDVSQIFTFQAEEDGSYAIIYRDTMALTVSGDGSVVVDNYTGSPEQRWYLETAK